MSINEFITQLKDNDIEVSLSGDELKIDFWGETLSDDLVTELRTKKAEIISFLKKTEDELIHIPAVPEMDGYPVSSPQYRSWIMSQLQDNHIAYNMPLARSFGGNMNLEALDYAIRKIQERHESLRTTFREDENGDVKQHIAAPGVNAVGVIKMDLRGAEGQEEMLKRLIREEIVKPFNLQTGPLLRTHLYRIRDNKWIFTFVTHHIIGDSWSMGVLMRELLYFYYIKTRGEEDTLAPLRVQYKDYTLWMQSQLGESILKKDRLYWEKQLGGELPALDIAGDRPRHPIKTYNGGMAIRKEFSPEVYRKFKTVTQEMGGTSFMGIISALNTLFYRYSHQEDVIIGFPIAGREHPDLLSQIGFYVNTLAVRTRFEGNKPYTEMLQHVKRNTLDAYEHRLYPFDELVSSLNIKWDKSRSAVFDVFVVLQPNEENNKGVGMFMDDMTLDEYVLGGNNPLCPFDLIFNFSDNGEELKVIAEFNSDIYNRSTVLRLLNHYERIMEAMANTPNLPLNELDYLNESEKLQLVAGFNDASGTSRFSNNVADLVENRGEEKPDATALVYNNDRYTYADINRSANQLAAFLKRHYNVMPGDPLVIKGHRNPWVVIAVLAATKLGSVYTLVDADQPGDITDAIIYNVAACAIIDDNMVQLFMKEQGMYANVQMPAVTIPSGLVNISYMWLPDGSLPRIEMYQADWLRLFHELDNIAKTEKEKFTSHAGTNIDAALSEILWALANGLEVTIDGNTELNAPVVAAPEQELRPLDFSIFYFGNDGSEFESYRMLLEGAKFADENGFIAVWTPERHFNAFGAPYPNPSVLGAALAAITKNVQIRAGSVVVPLHNPIRIAEEWSIVDNLSGGRVGFACATGWHTRDFVFFPENYANRHAATYKNIETVRALWRGEAVEMKDGIGETQEYRIYPRPVQKELPLWITSGGNIETFISAGRLGFGLLTNLLHGTLDDLGVKIAAYKKAYRDNGHPPGGDKMVLMLHSYMEDTLQGTLDKVRKPFIEYLKTSLGLIQQVAKMQVDLETLEQVTDSEMDEMLEYSFERYVTYASLVGTQESCMKILEKCSEIGVDEVACLIDFGVEHGDTMDSLVHLTKLKDAYKQRVNLQNQSGMSGKLRSAVETFYSHLIGGQTIGIPAELKLQLSGSNGHAKAATTIVDMFNAQVIKNPDAPALVLEDGVATYREVNEAANQLAHYLIREKGVKLGDLVALSINRTHWMPITLLAVLKAGAAYVPIDPEFPQNRIDYILSDSQCRLLFTEAELEQFKPVAGNYEKNNPHVTVSPTNLAYVMYTSGSTGQPKGVMLEHRNVTSFFGNIEPVFMMKPGMAFGASTSYTFDISVLELLGSLVSGMRLHVINNPDPQHIVSLLREGKINVLQITPSRLNQIMEVTDDITVFSHLKVLLIGGEAMTQHQYSRLKELGTTQVFNVYGPTETTIWSTCLHLQKSQALTIGRPLQHETVFILNSANQLAPSGITGEICISGPGLARGYMNKPELTAEKFVPNPFIAGEKMYRTGDLGRWLPDGTIEFWGRIDNQVKVRGYRIELGEIENVLQSHPDVDAAAVMLYTVAGGEKEMVAYITSGKQLNISELRGWLGKSLPGYMIPAQYMQLPAMPLNQSGKVDRKQLPDPGSLDMLSGVEYIAPRNEVEQGLVTIWQSLLGRLKVGVKDNFFELGGHSLRATRLASQIHKDFNVKITLRDVFTYVILEDQARFISNAGKVVFHAIEKAPEMDGYPLSSAQSRLWILSQFEEANIAYNMPGVNTFEGVMDREALQNAYRALVKRHESLRTIFRYNGEGELRQYLLDEEDTAFDIAYHDMRNVPGKEATLAVLVQEALVSPFNLAEGPLVKCELYQVEDFKWVFVYVMHHIISDAWSMDILMSELLTVYNAYNAKMEHTLPPITLQYKDFAYWQQQQLNGGELEAQRQYWLNKFEGEVPVLELPGDYPRPALKTYNGGVVYKPVNARITNGLKAVCQQQGCTLFMGIVAAVNTLFHRYTGQDDIIIGTTIAGREHANLQDQIGFYVNSLALRTQFSSEDSFRQLLTNVRQVTLGAFDNQEYPFDELVNALQLHRDMSRSPLVDVMVVLHNTGDAAAGAPDTMGGDISIEGYGSDALISKYDFSLNFFESGEDILLRIEYNSDIYSKETAERLGTHLELILQGATQQPDKAIATINYMPETEHGRILYGFNNTTTAYPSDKTIPELFAEQAAKAPAKTALAFEGGSLTYAELDEKSTQLAVYLRATYQLAPDDLVGIMLDRSDKMIIAILAVLKAGAGYVPVEADYPESRKAHILQDTAVKLLITQTEYIFDLQFFSGPVFAIDVQGVETDAAAPANLPALTPGNLAYVMYTSGSTGAPKGVMVEHRGVVRLVKNTNYVQLTGDEVLLSTGSVSFDATTFEYWGTLLNGGTLVLCSKEVLLDSKRMAALIEEKGVNIMWFTAGWLQQLAEEDMGVFKNLQTILAGGDRLSPVHIHNIKTAHPHLTIINGYGPTENTTFSLAYTIDEVMDNIPVGGPISNSTAYIVDDRLQLLPVGVPGEICVGGDGLARGYINQVELTAAKFVMNPLVPGTRMYKTGDLGRWLPDGTIQFLGRKDNQVKIRGFRVEPGEIENVLENHPAIAAAAVIPMHTASGDKELVAYIVSDLAQAAELNSYLGQQLPDYMIPARYVSLAELPLNANGKVDRRKLQEMGAAESLESGIEHIAPRNEVEEKLVAIWQEVLERDNIGIRHNFFESGGHSLKATRLVLRMKREFNVDVSLTTVFTEPTIEQLAERISQELWLQGNQDNTDAGEDMDRIEI